MADFFIIIPTFNSAAFLDQCLASVTAAQPGRFGLRVRIQDGGSTDATLEIAKSWESRGVTIASEKDQGLYDALYKASKDLRPGEIMTWLGSDDLLMPGALATAASIFDQLPEVEWITGQPFVANDKGESFTPGRKVRFIRSELAAGKYDGRSKGFVMQEGTFWRGDLWLKAGGIDRNFQLAGDWDLWRRFSQHTPLYALSFPLGRFTRRDGQKSQDMKAYYREVDAASPLPEVTDSAFYELTRCPWKKDWTIKTRKLSRTKRLIAPLRRIRVFPRKLRSA